MKTIHILLVFASLLLVGLILGCISSNKQEQTEEAAIASMEIGSKEVQDALDRMPEEFSSKFCHGVLAGLPKANVTKVIDGDTIEISSGATVRLICIDAPEIEEPFYEEAKQKTTDLLLNKEVCLEKDVSDTDQDGRLLRYVYNCLDGNCSDKYVIIEPGSALTFHGLAVVDRHEPDTTHCGVYETEQARAKESKRGIWA